MQEVFRSEYRRFIAYLYEYPTMAKGGCLRRLCPRGVANGFCTPGFSQNQIAEVASAEDLRSTSNGFIRRSAADVSAFRSEISLRGALPTFETLHALRCHWADGCHASTTWRSDPATAAQNPASAPPQWDDLPIQPEFFAPTLPQEPKTIRNNGARPTKRKLAETTRTSGSRRTCAVPAITDAFKNHSSETLFHRIQQQFDFIHKIPTRIHRLHRIAHH